jgi:glycosyltransferase involved in cell wall biosynthesis
MHFIRSTPASRRAPSKPLVTIGVPVFNGEKYLAQALRSIVEQTFDDFEVIISDNGSTDGTETICREFASRDRRIRYHRAASNHGAGWNFNRTAELAAGEYFKWMAHDDVIEPTFLERCVEPLERDESFVLCFPLRRYVVGSSVIPDTETTDLHDVGMVDLLRRDGGSFPLMLFGVVRTDALRSTRLLRSFRGSDIVILSELRQRGRFYQVPEVLFDQRVHEAVPRDRTSLKTEVRDFWALRGMKGLDRFPHVKVTVEVIRGSHCAGCPSSTRLLALAGAVGYFVAMKGRDARPVLKLVHRAWSLLVLQVIERSDRSSAWPRALCCVSGVWNRDTELIRLATSDFTESSARLQRFLAQKLKSNMDARSARIMCEWLEGPDGVKSEAAASAMAVPTPWLLEKLRMFMTAEEASNVIRHAQRLAGTPSDDSAATCRTEDVAG